jgi:hypothetical protein
MADDPGAACLLGAQSRSCASQRSRAVSKHVPARWRRPFFDGPRGGRDGGGAASTATHLYFPQPRSFLEASHLPKHPRDRHSFRPGATRTFESRRIWSKNVEPNNGRVTPRLTSLQASSSLVRFCRAVWDPYFRTSSLRSFAPLPGGSRSTRRLAPATATQECW